MIDAVAAKEPFSLKSALEWLRYKIHFNVSHPTYFNPDGLVCFVGAQGTGKTLSAVNYVYKLMEMYPKAKLVTNLMLKDYPILTYDAWLKQFSIAVSNRYTAAQMEYWEHAYMYDLYRRTNRVFPFNDADDLSRYENGEEGVIYLIDEIHLYFNSLESKNINPEVMTQIAQQRKQRKHIVCTSQIFGRMAKPLREQFSAIISCKKYFGCIQKNSLVDRDSVESNKDDMHVEGKVLRNFWSIHNPKMYGRYDTYYTISKTKFVSNELKKGDIYDHDRDTSGV